MNVDTIYIMPRSERGISYWSAFITPGAKPVRRMAIPIVDWASAAEWSDAIGFLVEQLAKRTDVTLANSVQIVDYASE